MDALTLLFVAGFVTLFDWIAFKYRSALMMLTAGLLATYALANAAVDGKVTVDFASTPYSFTAPNNDYNVFLAMLSLLAIVHFAMLLERRLSKEVAM